MSIDCSPNTWGAGLTLGLLIALVGILVTIGVMAELGTRRSIREEKEHSALWYDQLAEARKRFRDKIDECHEAHNEVARLRSVITQVARITGLSS